jgi:hypothetical protein
MIQKILNEPASSFGAILIFLGMFVIAVGVLAFLFGKLNEKQI